MDLTEERVARYLAHLGYTDVIYEPDGNVPPDFLINGRIAVEARRLNQHHTHGTKTKGLEEVARPLVDRLSKLIESVGPSPPTESWFVFFRFNRPVPSWEVLKDHITRHLNHFAAMPIREKTEFEVNLNFDYDVLKAAKVYETFFTLGGYCDHDSGGWVISEMLRNLELCIKGKTEKIAGYRRAYPEWWLILTDHIGFGLRDEDDRHQLREAFKMKHDWDKIILISPNDPTYGFTLSERQPDS
jgi:hypothetical protein